MHLLGLEGDFDGDALRRAYHRRLFEIHPDTATSVDDTPGLHVSELIEARDYLEQWIFLRDESRDERGRESSSDPEFRERTPDGEGRKEAPGAPGGSDGYEWYRQADRIFAAALELYWRERLKYSRLPDETTVLGEFRGRLREARALFVRVLDRYPGGIWTPDAVEKIARINAWLDG